MNIMNFKGLLLATMLTVPALAHAEDIDLFLGGVVDPGTPNVLIILDNTGNWSSPFLEEQAALVAIFEGLRNKPINVGLMMFTETGGENSNVAGGYVRAAIRPMNTGSNADLYANMIGEFHKDGDKSNSGKAGLAMAEAYHYFKGATTAPLTPPYAGNNKAKTDYDGNDSYDDADLPCCTESKLVWALADNALETKGATQYNSPIDPTSCGKNYIIYISNGPVQDASADNRKAEILLTAQGGNITQINISPSGSADVVADEWARFMKESTLGITTYTVDVDPGTTGQGPGWSELLESMGRVSGGERYVTGSSDLSGIVDGIFNRILAVNSVFASVALPAASNAQSTFLNRVYVGQFRPDKNSKPRWPGNLKQYKLGLPDTEVKLLDAKDVEVVEIGTGFIKECAESYWAPAAAATDNYWAFDPKGTCNPLDPNEPNPNNAPDGPIVEKGGQAYTVRASNPATRKIYTCSPTMATCSTTATLPEFTTTALESTITLAAMGELLDLDPNDPLYSENTAALINWGRGQDLLNEDGDPDTPLTRMRPSAHGDIVHSRPVAVNYGSDIVVYYGGNDGMLRAINGNRSGASAGYELWAFMPPEFYGSLNRLKENSLVINTPASGQSAATGGASKPYGMDGPITAFEGSVGGNDEVYIYASMRRAGRVVYAFDVTDPTVAPEMLWKIGCPNLDNNTDCAGTRAAGGDDATLAKIGQTWSPPSVIYSAGYTDGDGKKPMLIMGGGYHECEDYDNDIGGASGINHQCDTVDNGKVIYLLDAVTGNVLQTFETDRAVVGEIRIVTATESGPYASYAYAADTGGNVYRISAGTAGTDTNPGSPVAFGITDPETGWVISKIAALGCGGQANVPCNAPRKFLFGPDVVRVPLSSQLSILVGSGDREKPLVSYGAANDLQNYFFSFIDDPTQASTWLDLDTLCGFDQICMTALTTVATDGAVVPGPYGFKLPLTGGEQVVSGAITVADIAHFSTHIPTDPSEYNDPNSPNFCKNTLGTATTYKIDYRDADGDTVNIIGGGLVPTPVAGQVILDNGTIVPFCIGCGGDGSAIGGSSVGSGITWIQPKTRVYWNIQK